MRLALSPMHKGRVVSACDRCGTRFLHWTCEDRRFCSRRCVNAARREAADDRNTRWCGACGAPFVARCPSDPQRFCSPRCHYSATTATTERPCDWCHQAYRRNPADVGRFCSQGCYDTARRAGASAQPTSRRRAPRRRAACACCGDDFSYTAYGQRERTYCSDACARAGRRRPAAERFWSYVQKSDGCWSWSGQRREQGRGFFSPGYGAPSVAAARYSWELTYGPVPDGLCVCHNCPGGDNPNCVRPDHLFLATVAENLRDASRKGGMSRGEERPNVRLSPDDVLSIRRAAAAPGLQASLARQYGVSRQTIAHVRARRTWAWLADEDTA